MKTSGSPDPPFYRSETFRGTVWGLLSAFAYALTNIVLRDLATDTNATLVTCMKAVPTLVLACMLLGHDVLRSRFELPSRRLTLALIVTAIIVQFAGNLALQAAFGLIGLALTVPLSFGTLIVASAVISRAWLGEPIRPPMLLSMGLLVVSIGLLTLGAEQVQDTLPQAETSLADYRWSAVLGVLVACTSGLGYSLIAVVIRRVGHRTSVPVILFLFSVTGIAVLAPLAVAQVGPAGLASISTTTWMYMLLGGSLNALGFYALGRSLRLLAVMHANLLNASQVAISAVAGIMLFQEPSSWPLMLGVALAIVGLVVLRDSPPAEPV